MSNNNITPSLSFVSTSDISGIVRGKSFPSSQWEKRKSRGVGWTPTNLQITCFDTIAESPFESFGDLALVPDETTRFVLPQFSNNENISDFALGDILELDGNPWDFCLRSKARHALEQLHDQHSLLVTSAFEHEFQLVDQKPHLGDGFGFKGFRDAEGWSHALLHALEDAGITLESFMKEYGPSQYELTVTPKKGITPADEAVKMRELVKDVLRHKGHHASFSPILDPESVGNGVHIHFSFSDLNGHPVTYDPSNPYGLSETSTFFIGGILAHLKDILAFLAPSEISYLRLTPHRWSAAYNNLGFRDREASVRICPVTALEPVAIAKQFNFEVRAVDGAASPYLAYAALLYAGAEGIKERIMPPAVTEEDLSLLKPKDLLTKGIKRLPQTLSDALTELSGSSAVRRWFGDDFVDVYIKHKNAELDFLKDKSWEEKCGIYKGVY